MRLLSIFLLASILGLSSAAAQDRSDAMLRAFRDACFPHLGHFAAQRQKAIEAGFIEAPRAVIAGVDLEGGTVIIDSAGQEIVPETYRGQREGLRLSLSVLTLAGTRITHCSVFDFGAAGPVSEKKVADWIKRPADDPARSSQHGSKWSSSNAPLPGGYDEVESAYLPASALLQATARSSQPAAK